jgi:peptide-methionine (R)-S-oxide reductase
MVTRRQLMAGASAGALLAALGPLRKWAFATEMAKGNFAVTHTDAEWRQMLTPNQYRILRQAQTEEEWSSPLLQEHRDGIYECAGCALTFFKSEWKYDSDEGWPSFWTSVPGTLDKMEDDSANMVRTELHCHRCGSHIGHLFNDGPQPTGLRYCMDGLALKFVPA